jgi:hypothetical protein
MQMLYKIPESRHFVKRIIARELLTLTRLEAYRIVSMLGRREIYIFINTLFTRELPGRGCKGHNEEAGGADRCNFARRADIEEEPTPDPAT